MAALIAHSLLQVKIEASWLSAVVWSVAFCPSFAVSHIISAFFPAVIYCCVVHHCVFVRSSPVLGLTRVFGASWIRKA